MSTTSLLATAATNSLIRTGDGTPVQAASGLVDATGVAALFLNASGNFVDQAGAAVLPTSLVAQSLSGAGAVDITHRVTILVTTGANALTLADGSYTGQEKVIVMKTDGGDGTLTPAHLVGGTTLTFNDAGDSVLLCFNGTAWAIVSNNGATLA